MTLKTRIFAHHPRVQLARLMFCWWRHSRLVMTSQWPDNCDTNTWQVISNLSILFTAIFTAGRVRNVCMYVCVCVCVYMYIHICACSYAYAYEHAYAYAYAYAYVYVYVYVNDWKGDTSDVKYSLSSRLIKGLRMVARALWRSEASRVVPWSETLHEP